MAGRSSIKLGDNYGVFSSSMVFGAGSIHDLRGPSSISVNGRRFEVKAGESLSCINGKVTINGRPVDDVSKAKQVVINVYVTGNVEGPVSTENGEIKIDGDVKGTVTAGGNATCKNIVGGSASTISGVLSVKGNVGGSVSTVSGRIDVGGDVYGNASSVSGSVRAAGRFNAAVPLPAPKKPKREREEGAVEEIE